jgi:hypothetical protein
VIAGLPLSEVAKRLAASKLDDYDDVALFDEWQEWLRDNIHRHESG